jgi:hypothetical protein
MLGRQSRRHPMSGCSVPSYVVLLLLAVELALGLRRHLCLRVDVCALDPLQRTEGICGRDLNNWDWRNRPRLVHEPLRVSLT